MTPRDELDRARAFFDGRISSEPKLTPARKAELLANEDGRRCPTCSCKMRYLKGKMFGHEVSDAATVEHIAPNKMGGSNERRNLAVRCNLCNRASGHSINEWMQRRVNPTWEEICRVLNYLWLEVRDTSKANELYPEFFAAFQRKRNLLKTKLAKREVRV